MSDTDAAGPTWVRGRDVKVGDVIAYARAGFLVARFGPYDGPLSFGGARIAYTMDGRAMTVFDNYQIRLAGPR